MPGRALLAALVFFVVINVRSAAAAEGVSLASIGYTMLRWLDRAEIAHHNLSVEVDPPAFPPGLSTRSPSSPGAAGTSTSSWAWTPSSSG